jgi:hypothetical protein
MGVKVDPDHWQTCITEELLDMVQSGKAEEARSTLMSNLLNGKVTTSADD